MKIAFRYGKDEIVLDVPQNAHVYQPTFELGNNFSSEQMLKDSIFNPEGSLSLKEKLSKRRNGKVVIVVSDITRPIPYKEFLPVLLDHIEKENINRNEIIILIATGMHRASSMDEKRYMFGDFVVENYTIIDHDAENSDELLKVGSESWSGAEIELNKYYVEAGFRILTGLVEPHFMAGFSGGRKSICPGLSSLETIKKFHGFHFLNHPSASNTVLDNNPCHLESSSIADRCPGDFSINVILDQKKKINKIISGEQFISHEKAVEYVKQKSCLTVPSKIDLAITSCGGYPLDDTFYQCVKGFVNCLPSLKDGGKIVALGNCSEGIGSIEYESLMKKYYSRSDDFLDDIKNRRFFIKDQWQFQMHIKVLKKIGKENLHFYTSEISPNDLELLSVTPHSLSKTEIADSIQNLINKAVTQGKKIAVFPEGPYCSPILN